MDVVIPVRDENGIDTIKILGTRADIVSVESASAVKVVAFRQDPAGFDWPNVVMARVSRRRVRSSPGVLWFNEEDLVRWLAPRYRA
jgi:hypothetical protein